MLRWRGEGCDRLLHVSICCLFYHVRERNSKLLCSAKLQRTERAVEEYRNQIDIRKAENYGFASMAAVPYSHIVANLLRRKRVKGCAITLAPNPKDLVSVITGHRREFTLTPYVIVDLGEPQQVHSRVER